MWSSEDEVNIAVKFTKALTMKRMKFGNNYSHKEKRTIIN